MAEPRLFCFAMERRLPKVQFDMATPPENSLGRAIVRIAQAGHPDRARGRRGCTVQAAWTSRCLAMVPRGVMRSRLTKAMAVIGMKLVQQMICQAFAPFGDKVLVEVLALGLQRDQQYRA